MIYNDASHDILHFQIQNKTAFLKANYFHLRICLRMVINGRGFTLGRGELLEFELPCLIDNILLCLVYQMNTENSYYLLGLYGSSHGVRCMITPLRWVE